VKRGSKSVLILGGYGAAGTAIATLLGQRIEGNIVLAGRSLEKGRKRAEQLDREAGATGRFSARSIDVAAAEKPGNARMGRMSLLSRVVFRCLQLRAWFKAVSRLEPTTSISLRIHASLKYSRACGHALRRAPADSCWMQVLIRGCLGGWLDGFARPLRGQLRTLRCMGVIDPPT
jgi:hypothetical protein